MGDTEILRRNDVPAVHFNAGKTLPPANKNIEFSPIYCDTRIEDVDEPKKVEKLRTVEKMSGRPKNTKLSALAAKRKGTKKTQQTSSEQKSVDSQTKKATIEEPPTPTATTVTPCSFDGKNSQEIAEDKPTKKKFEISSMDKLAVSHNIVNMVTQMRQKESDISVLEIANLTSGIRTCEEKPTSHYFKDECRGMKLLFPGKDKRNRKLFVNALHNPYSRHRHADDMMLKPNDSSKKVTPFDFSSCPFEAVAEAVRLEALNSKLKRKQPKRLVSFDSQSSKPQKKAPNLDLDSLSAKRLLKNRLKEDAGRNLNILLMGPTGSGKSSLMSSLIGFCDPDSFPEKSITKVKWEAEKAGRPRDYMAWLVDELPSERRCGHSWFPSDASVTLPSGRHCHFYDCPGDQLSVFSDLSTTAHVFVIVVDVTLAAAGDAETRTVLQDYLMVIEKMHEFDSPQLIVVLNQMDRCNYATIEANRAKDFCSKLISELKMNFKPSIQFIPTCVLTNDGITEKTSRPENGRVSFKTSLIETFESVKMVASIPAEPNPIDLKPLVLRVRDVYKNMGAGFTAVADVVQGLVMPDQSLICLPSAANLTVRTVQLSRGGRLVPVKCAAHGEVVHLVLWQVDMAAVTRGSIICHPLLSSSDHSPYLQNYGVQVKQRFEARIHIHNLHGQALFKGRQMMFHGFGTTIPTFVSRLLWVRLGPDSRTDVKLKPMAVSRTGTTVGVELILESPHVFIPSLDVGLNFSLMINNSLLATGVVTRPLDNEPAVEALSIPDCSDVKRLLFHRSYDHEQMEVD